MPTKPELRNKLLAERRLLTMQKVRMVSELVMMRLLNLPILISAHSVHVYSSNAAWNEIDTVQLCHHLHQQYPQLIIETSSITAQAKIPTNSYDVIIIPVLGFDKLGNRLGLGKGWYDRFLETQPKGIKIGLAYSWAQVDTVPADQYDVPLDYVITELETMRPYKN